MSVGIFSGLAALTIVLRTAARFWTIHRLKLDDLFLWFALLCLSAATGIFYSLVHVSMLEEAVSLDPTVVVPYDQLDSLLSSWPYLHSLLSLMWTCIFSVKASFLAMFRLMIRHVSKPLTIYYWAVVVYMVLAWMFMVSEAFILCPHFGLDQGKTPLAPFRKILRQAHLENSKVLPQTQLPQDVGSDNLDNHH